jgi:hypothetical protein
MPHDSVLESASEFLRLSRKTPKASRYNRISRVLVKKLGVKFNAKRSRLS